MTIYVDSGAGQSLCSCSSAFADMTPCKVEIAGIFGSLQIYAVEPPFFSLKIHLGRLLFYACTIASMDKVNSIS